MKHTRFFVFILAAMMALTSAAKRQRNAAEEQPTPTVMEAFNQQLQADPFLSDAAQEQLNKEIEDHIHSLLNWSDKAAYTKEHHLQQYVDELRQKLEACKSESSLTIERIQEQYQDIDALQRVAYRDSMQAVLDDKLGTLENNINRLSKELVTEEETSGIDWENMDWKTIGIIAGAVLLLIIILIIARRRSRKKDEAAYYGNSSPATTGSRSPSRPAQGQRSGNGNDPGIVVRRKTATILKKQSLEDVIDNPNYMQVDAIDFCYESAVRRMYIKNTCVIDIYNMYAEDLRNPDSPKEDGCMVLGRWVHDPDNNEYYVSLEEIVLPGDDAVFEEYALNFGGKIKLKVLEQLRKLRRETNLQYDLTCWVHSHPGLGVFFSNSDTSVQDQLKHPIHPNFLTAIVVDILTPMQDLGIFTYQRDTTINSKNDLKKMYSLIAWYQWAKESLASAPRQAAPTPADTPKDFKPVAYYDTLQNCELHNGQCSSVQLSKDVVVDICMALNDYADDRVGMIHGTIGQHGQQTVATAEQLSDNEQEPKFGLVGCFMTTSHCSIPTVRRAVVNYLDRIKFVLVYTPNDGLLTSIPVVDGDLVVEVEYHGEQRLEALKSWIKQGR